MAMQHDVIMCPVSYCYFDYYQGDPETQPKAIGGNTTLKKVYSFEPMPPELNGEEAAHVLGAQGNVWTEYIVTPEHAEYMAVPRMTALAEVVWSDKASRNWDDFNERLQQQFIRFNMLNVNFCRGSFKIGMKTRFDTLKSSMHILFESEIYKPVIRYTINGKDPDLKSKIYGEPVKLIANTTVKAGIFQNDTLLGGLSEKTIVLHEGIGKKVIYTESYSHKYPGDGDRTLFDGIRGSDYFNDGCWLGFEGNDLEVTIDLKKVLPLYKISAGFHQNNRSWIFLPVSVEYLSSMNGNQFNPLATIVNNISPAEEKPIIKDFTVEFKPVKARYVKILARNMGVCPKWHPGAGEKAWIFADEIMID
jgi:hexosaminidase